MHCTRRQTPAPYGSLSQELSGGQLREVVRDILAQAAEFGPVAQGSDWPTRGRLSIGRWSVSLGHVPYFGTTCPGSPEVDRILRPRECLTLTCPKQTNLPAWCRRVGLCVFALLTDCTMKRSATVM